MDAAAEREVVSWIQGRRHDDDVAVIASDVYTIHGGWRELEQIRGGRKYIAPMGIEGLLRSWSPDSESLRATLDLWERDYNVRFIIIYDVHWRQTAEPQNRVLREYIERNFDLGVRLNLGGTDYYSDVRIYQRSSGVKGMPKYQIIP